MAATSIRLDQAMVERGLAETRSRAKSFIMAGDVLVNGEKVPYKQYLARNPARGATHQKEKNEA